jgi:hypothetical protein
VSTVDFFDATLEIFLMWYRKIGRYYVHVVSWLHVRNINGIDVPWGRAK